MLTKCWAQMSALHLVVHLIPVTIHEVGVTLRFILQTRQAKGCALSGTVLELTFEPKQFGSM